MYSKGIKIIVTTLLITLLGTCFVFAAEVPSDVSGKSCEAAVSDLMDEGVITGDTDGLFHPDSELTRAQVCIMIAKTIDSAGINNMGYIQSGKKFKDMDGYNWAAGATGMMAEKKMAKGYSDGNFRPGANVTMAELITFAVRACGDEYTDENIGGTWPENYIEAAKKLGFIGNEDTSDYQTQTATKADAAIVVWKAMKTIKENQKEDAAKEEKTDIVIDDYTFGNIKFNKAVSYINNDIPISENAVIYSYGKASEYTKNMSVPSKSKLEKMDIYKYQNVSTKALYKVIKGEVTEIILPENCGFSGKIYGVINSADFYETKDGTVIEFETLSAGKDITWSTKANVVSKSFGEENFIRTVSEKGELIELTAVKGKITAVKTGNEMTGKYHNELTDSKVWTQLTKRASTCNELVFNNEDNSGTEIIEISENAIIYIYDSDSQKYEVGTIGSLKKDYYVRAYDVTDDDDESADIILAVENID